MPRLSFALVILAAASLSACAPQQQLSGRCIDAVTAFRNSGELRVEGGSAHQAAARDTVKTYLVRAEQAAARGDERGCWDWYSSAKSTLVY